MTPEEEIRSLREEIRSLREERSALYDIGAARMLDMDNLRAALAKTEKQRDDDRAELAALLEFLKGLGLS